jgi:hypothetical protein
MGVLVSKNRVSVICFLTVTLSWKPLSDRRAVKWEKKLAVVDQTVMLRRVGSSPSLPTVNFAASVRVCPGTGAGCSGYGPRYSMFTFAYASGLTARKSIRTLRASSMRLG